MNDDAKESWEKALFAALNGVPENSLPKTTPAGPSQSSNFQNSGVAYHAPSEEADRRCATTAAASTFAAPGLLLFDIPTDSSEEEPDCSPRSESNIKHSTIDYGSTTTAIVAAAAEVQHHATSTSFQHADNNRHHLSSDGATVSQQQKRKEDDKVGTCGIIEATSNPRGKRVPSIAVATSGGDGDDLSDERASAGSSIHSSSHALRQQQQGQNAQVRKTWLKDDRDTKATGKRQRRHWHNNQFAPTTENHRDHDVGKACTGDGVHGGASSSSGFRGSGSQGRCTSERSRGNAGSDDSRRKGRTVKRLRNRLQEGTPTISRGQAEPTRRLSPSSIAASRAAEVRGGCDGARSSTCRHRAARVRRRVESGGSDGSDGSRDDWESGRHAKVAAPLRRQIDLPRQNAIQRGRLPLETGAESTALAEAYRQGMKTQKAKRDRCGQVKFDSTDEESSWDNDEESKGGRIVGGSKAVVSKINGPTNEKKPSSDDNAGGVRRGEARKRKTSTKAAANGQEEGSGEDELDGTQRLKPTIAEPSFLDPGMLPLRLENEDGSQTGEVPVATNRYLKGFQKEGVSHFSLNSEVFMPYRF